MSTPSGYGRFLELPAQELAELRERARSLAATTNEAAETGDALEILEFVSHSETFAVPLSAVDGIIELTSLAAIPRAARFMRGLLAFRGDVLLAIELGLLSGGADVGFSDLKRVIAVSCPDGKVAILAEQIIGIRRAPASEFGTHAGGAGRFIQGTSAGFSSLVDVPRLLAALREGAGGDSG